MVELRISLEGQWTLVSYHLQVNETQFSFDFTALIFPFVVIEANNIIYIVIS